MFAQLLACAPSAPPPELAPVGATGSAETGSETHSDTAPADSGTPPAGVESNRDRLIRTYLEFLRASPDDPQSNGLRGADLPDVCALWDALDLSSRATFLTLTARLEGARLSDGTSLGDHLTRAVRITGGAGALGSAPGSCGGGEYNRLFASIDPAGHGALVAAADGAHAVADLEGWWGGSTDLAGPHTPFTVSLETESGAPRGQLHLFRDPGSAQAGAPLGRLDLESLVDPYLVELDHDFDCVHDSNPACSYTFYGPACLPEPTRLGVEIYAANYGNSAGRSPRTNSWDPQWRPDGC